MTTHNIAWYDIPALDLDRAINFYAAVQANGGDARAGIQSIGPFGFIAKVLDSEGNSISLRAGSDA